MKGTILSAAAALLVATTAASALPDERGWNGGAEELTTGEGMALDFVARSDIDGDGKVTITEYRATNAGTSEKWFRRLDANADGVGTAEELADWDSRKSRGSGG